MIRLALAFSLLATPALTDPAVIEAVEARESARGWTFSVTLSHDDTGWDNYADGWRVETDGGEVLGTRELLHPHDNEQPFTRSQSGIAVPEGALRVQIRASTNIEGWAETTTPFTMPTPG